MPDSAPRRRAGAVNIRSTVTSSLGRVVSRLLQRLESLDYRLDHGDEGVWATYAETATVLANLLSALPPETQPLLTTAELAKRLGVSSKTVLRRRQQGSMRPALQHGRLIRWKADQVGR